MVSTVEDMFDEMLDECYPVVKIGELTFYPRRFSKSATLSHIVLGLANMRTWKTNQLDKPEKSGGPPCG